MWNVGDITSRIIPRTNNSIEGWHSTFIKTFGVSIYSFVLLVVELKDEKKVIRQKQIKMDNNESFKRKKGIKNGIKGCELCRWKVREIWYIFRH